MGRPFRQAYASLYDSLYAEKDYDGEVELLEALFHRFDVRGRRLLDLGCGTGNHALRLALRGYDVSGVDQSSSMVEIARTKAAAAGADCTFSVGDMADVRLPGRFDAVLLMFAVLSYKRTNDEVLATLANVRRHLDPGGVVVLDVWHGPGVLTDPPVRRTTRILTSDGTVTRTAVPLVDVRASLCTIDYELARPDGSVEHEQHVVRFFFPTELELFLSVCGFDLLTIAPFGAPDAELQTSTWNVLVAARANGRR